MYVMLSNYLVYNSKKNWAHQDIFVKVMLEKNKLSIQMSRIN